MEIESDSDDDVTGADLAHTNCILKDYVLLETLGTGGFSCIRKVSRFNKTNGEEEYFALKIIRQSLKISKHFDSTNKDVVKKRNSVAEEAESSKCCKAT